LERTRWDRYIDALRSTTEEPPTYAQVVGVVNELSNADDYVMTAAGGLPGELVGGWRSRGTANGPTMDVEYGFSCMGYELCGAWGAAMARARTHTAGIVTTLLGDGSYLMLNSEVFSAAFAGHPFVAVVCDNGGFAVIARLQEGKGAPAHNNMLDTSHGPGAATGLRVDFGAHAASLGASVFAARSVSDLREMYARARVAACATTRPAIVVVATRPSAWTDAGAWWEIGVPAALSGAAEPAAGKARQVRILRS